MSKNTRRRSIRLENLQNDSRTNLNHVSRSPKNTPNTPFKTNSLLNRNKLDIKFTKVSKPANVNDSISKQQPQRSIFRTGNLFGLKDTSNRANQEFPSASNSKTNEPVTKMDQDQSNGNISFSNPTSNIFKQFSIPDPSSAIIDDKHNSDSSTTFYEPDSTVDDDLDTDLLFDSNGPIDESVLTENTSSNIPIVSKSSFQCVTDYETPKKNLSVKKLTQFKPSTPQKAKTVVTKVKSNNRRRSQTKYSQNSSFDEIFPSPQNSSSKNIQNPTKKRTAASKRSNLNRSSQPLLRTPPLCNPINSRSTGKTKPKNSPLVCKNPPTSNFNSKPRSVSPELFVSDHDSNQISSNDLVLPSPDNPTQHGRTLVSRNRLGTPQDTNSVSTPPVTNPSHQMKKSLRYPLRSTTSSPVIYELPVIHRIRSNSSSASIKVDDSLGKINAGRSKIPIRKPTVPKSAMFSQYSSVHGSLLDINTPRDTQTQNDSYDIDIFPDTQTQSDVYDFVSNSPPTKPQNRKKKKRGSCWLQKSRSRRTPAKKASQMNPISNSSILTPIIDSNLNVSTKKKPQTPKTNTFFNPNAFSDLTNQVSKRTRAASSRSAKNEENFLSSMFSQGQLTSSQPSSIFNPSNSQGFGNLTLNSPRTVFNQTTTPIQSHRYSHTYGGLLSYIDTINHNNTDTEMDELCNLFKLLKISDLRTHWKSSFLSYRDAGRIERPFVNRIERQPQRKISFLGNPFMSYRSSNSIVEKNELQFAPIPENSITNEINLHRSEIVAGAPSKSNDATEDTILSARAAIKTISRISLKVPHYFYADGEYNFDGFSDWD